MDEVTLKKLLDRIESVLARAGERWLDPESGEEFIRAQWSPENSDTEQVCIAQKDKDGSVIVLNPIDMPFCRISTSAGIEAPSEQALQQIVAWLDELEATLEK